MVVCFLCVLLEQVWVCCYRRVGERNVDNTNRIVVEYVYVYRMYNAVVWMMTRNR